MDIIYIYILYIYIYIYIYIYMQSCHEINVPQCYHNGLGAIHALGHMMYGYNYKHSVNLKTERKRF